VSRETASFNSVASFTATVQELVCLLDVYSFFICLYLLFLLIVIVQLGSSNIVALVFLCSRASKLFRLWWECGSGGYQYQEGEGVAQNPSPWLPDQTQWRVPRWQVSEWGYLTLAAVPCHS